MSFLGYVELLATDGIFVQLWCDIACSIRFGACNLSIEDSYLCHELVVELHSIFQVPNIGGFAYCINIQLLLYGFSDPWESILPLPELIRPRQYKEIDTRSVEAINNLNNLHDIRTHTFTRICAQRWAT